MFAADSRDHQHGSEPTAIFHRASRSPQRPRITRPYREATALTGPELMASVVRGIIRG